MTTQMDSMLLSAGLNRTQRKFCKLPTNKNIRLLAPAGSGKTYSILWRCRCLIEKAISAEDDLPNFLVVTFTRAAAMELCERIETIPEFALIDGHITIKTLNSWGWNQIRNPNKELVVGSRDRRNLVLHDLLPLIGNYPFIEKAISSQRVKNAETIIDLMDLYKMLGFTHSMNKRAYQAHVKYLKEIGLSYILNEGLDTLWKMVGAGDDISVRKTAEDDFFSFWKRAVVHLESVNRFTMEDQKYWPRINLENAAAEGDYPKKAAKYTHVFIDEFQDINPLDLGLIRAIVLAHGHGNPLPVTIVGDDDQAIFGWRGTTSKFILEPDKYIGGKFETCVLDTNYRSPKDIVEISAKLISYNRNRVEKEMKSAAKGKAYIKVVTKKKASAEMEAVMSIIRKVLNTASEGSIALIGRKQTTLFPYQVLLSASDIPYCVDADLDIFAGEAMQSLLTIFRTIIHARHNDNDDVVNDFLNICDKVGKYNISAKDRGALIRFLDRERVENFKDAVKAMRRVPENITVAGDSMADAVESLMKAETVSEFMTTVTEVLHGLDKDYNKRERDLHYKEPQFFRLTEISRKYGTDFSAFVRDIEYARKAGEAGRNQDDAYERAKDVQIHLVTATRSKGHEYDHVIILDGSQEEWPSPMTEDIEEERRLFYVAITRAKRYLYFVTTETKQNSRFLLEAGVV